MKKLLATLLLALLIVSVTPVTSMASIDPVDSSAEISESILQVSPLSTDYYSNYFKQVITNGMETSYTLTSFTGNRISVSVVPANYSGNFKYVDVRLVEYSNYYKSLTSKCRIYPGESAKINFKKISVTPGATLYAYVTVHSSDSTYAMTDLSIIAYVD